MKLLIDEPMKFFDAFDEAADSPRLIALRAIFDDISKQLNGFSVRHTVTFGYTSVELIVHAQKLVMSAHDMNTLIYDVLSFFWEPGMRYVALRAEGGKLRRVMVNTFNVRNTSPVYNLTRCDIIAI